MRLDFDKTGWREDATAFLGTNRSICDDIVQAVRDGRSPLVLTERNEHMDLLESGLSGTVRHLVVMRGGMGRKQRQAATERLAVIPHDEGRVILQRRTTALLTNSITIVRGSRT